jgi:NADPH:quinone reductase-like Zn-dependent oxidoreductase
MKAIVHRSYGSPDALEVVDVPLPAVADADVLVEVRAASLNPLDWHTLTGTPYLVRTQSGLRRPRTGRVGVDFAGVVTEVGSSVTASIRATRCTAPAPAHWPSMCAERPTAPSRRSHPV